MVYASTQDEKTEATRCLKMLSSLLDFEPCCILLYNWESGHTRQVEFDYNLIQIPIDANNPESSLKILNDLFPDRHCETTINEIIKEGKEQTEIEMI